MQYQSRKQNNSWNYFPLVLLLIAAAGLLACTEQPKPAPPPARPPIAQKQPIVSATTNTLMSASTKTAAGNPVAVEAKVEVYSYKPAGRRDPFAPIIEPAAKKARRGDLPPLERYNLNEFKLSGIIWGGFGYNAMLEGPDGKGYFVRVGTVIGPNGGIIKRITQANLVVEEKYKSYTGELERKEIVLQLQRKQEERP